VTSILIKKREGSKVRKNRIEERLTRLLSLQGSDPGFFLLVTHSFVEGYLRDFLGMHEMDYHFPDLLYKFKEKKLAETKGFIKELYALNDLNNRQSLVNGVRHSFEPIDQENICILVPSNKDVDSVQEVIEAAGYASSDLRENTFSFEDKNVIRISTLHSSKGLDFHIVLLLLRRSPFTGRVFDNDSLAKMKRNLIYVSLTRAMGRVNVFVLDGESKVEIRDLVEVFDEIHQNIEFQD